LLKPARHLFNGQFYPQFEADKLNKEVNAGHDDETIDKSGNLDRKMGGDSCPNQMGPKRPMQSSRGRRL